jgi:carboxylesterase type B
VYFNVDINNVTDSLPVVVMIHAETYDVGTGNAYDPSTLVALGNVIAVTLNFRLGVFG